MQYIVLERKVYERYSVVDADDPEEAKEIMSFLRMNLFGRVKLKRKMK